MLATGEAHGPFGCRLAQQLFRIDGIDLTNRPDALLPEQVFAWHVRRDATAHAATVQDTTAARDQR